MSFVRIELFDRIDNGKLKRFRWQEEGGWGSAFLQWLCGFLLSFSFSALVIWISNSQSNSLGEDSSQLFKLWLLFQLFPLFVNECAPYFDFWKKRIDQFFGLSLCSSFWEKHSDYSSGQTDIGQSHFNVSYTRGERSKSPDCVDKPQLLHKRQEPTEPDSSAGPPGYQPRGNCH